ncbi:hypothetical protein RJZ56_005001 [Blastomyces dermatitidis]|uniref:Letm1 RBD domain-containing protein n=2 Tax=Ajellomyces dermatitidis TaxID=5039 RepID=F2TSI4_AJEDA|nr:uncharacterized protein BDCG_05388 [Blastomyces dermatitidis ER-3]EEQ90268.1 hypothetical protein BDCG_05388 [Blastomyces dermatitidis ER-3]EGE86197.1 hypothetical protein BDDG_09142 [Blastomyces dermatitidis ATCC 18188]
MLANSCRGLCATIAVLPAGPRSARSLPQPTHTFYRQRIQHSYLLPLLSNNGAGIAHFSSTPGRPKPPPTTSTSTTATTTVQPVTITSPLNPPLSTLPAPLSLPEKDPSANKAKYYFALGKAYLSFYKTGLKNVYYNYRAALPLRSRLGLSLLLPTSPPPTVYAVKHINNAAMLRMYAKKVSRSEFQLIRRAAYDVRRMIPFSLILLLCGEMTPFVVLALGSVVTPFTCRVPRQVEKERVKACLRKEKAVRAAEVDGAAAAAAAAAAANGANGIDTVKATAIANLDVLLNATAIPHTVDINGLINHASTAGVLRACAVFRLSRGHEVTGSSFLPGFLVAEIVNQIYRPRLRKWMRYLEVDDWLIVKNGGVEGMSAEEVRIAVEERGGVDVSVGLKEGEAEAAERRWLENWVQGRGGEKMVERWDVELTE